MDPHFVDSTVVRAQQHAAGANCAVPSLWAAAPPEPLDGKRLLAMQPEARDTRVAGVEPLHLIVCYTAGAMDAAREVDTVAVELRASARYLLVDRTVVAERVWHGWWLLHEASTEGRGQRSWVVAPDGRIYQGPLETIQETNPATFRPLGPPTDLTAADLQFVGDGPYGESDLDRANRRTLE